MRRLSLILILVFLAVPVRAQEIYKWEDEKGILHYGDKPQQPGARPFSKEEVPYSNLKEGQGETRSEPEGGMEKKEPQPREPRSTAKAAPRPSPSMKGAKAWIDRRGDFALSGVLRNGGKGMCEAPEINVVVVDELGSVDGQFTINTASSSLSRGEEAAFAGSHFAPIGDKFTWEATPRCHGANGIVDGTRKRGTIKIVRHRTLKIKRPRSQRE